MPPASAHHPGGQAADIGSDDDQHAAGSQEFAHGGQQGAGVGHMFQNVQQGDNSEFFRRPRTVPRCRGTISGRKAFRHRRPGPPRARCRSPGSPPVAPGSEKSRWPLRHPGALSPQARVGAAVSGWWKNCARVLHPPGCTPRRPGTRRIARSFPWPGPGWRKRKSIPGS